MAKRRSRRSGATTSTYTYATTSQRLLNVGGQGLRSYDAAGNTTAITSGMPVAFAHDDRGRLREVRVGGVLQRTYLYNGRGERVLRTSPSGAAPTLQFVYDEAGRLLGEYQANGARVAEYVWVDDLLVAILRAHDGSTYQFVETDALGSPRAVIHPAANAVVWRWDLVTTAFGEHAPDADPDGNGLAYPLNLRYPGQYADGLGFNYNLFRDYDPATGRYLQSDPIGLLGGMNSYTYVGGNPMVAIDPLGLIHYNANPPQTVPVSGPTSTNLQCVENCLGKKLNRNVDLLISGGAETTGHSLHSRHYVGEACDVSDFNRIDPADIFACAEQCGFGGAQHETFRRTPRRNHMHLQLSPGNGVPETGLRTERPHF
jgi:RHS repeat-associated protein